MLEAALVAIQQRLLSQQSQELEEKERVIQAMKAKIRDSALCMSLSCIGHPRDRLDCESCLRCQDDYCFECAKASGYTNDMDDFICKNCTK